MQHEYIYIYFSKYLKILADFWSLSLNHVDTIPTTDVLFYATKRQDNGSTWNSLNNLNEALNFVQLPSLSLFLSDGCHPRESRLFSQFSWFPTVSTSLGQVFTSKKITMVEQKTIPGTLLPFVFIDFRTMHMLL